MTEIAGKADSREISKTIKDSARTASIQEYGDEKLPAGDLSGQEVIVVEGRADVLNLMKAGVNNVIAMNGTKLPDGVKELSQKKDIILFIDGDRGGKLIAQNVVDNAKVKYIAVAPDGKEVEELTGKEVLIHLRKKVPVEEFFSRGKHPRKLFVRTEISKKATIDKKKLKEIFEKNKGSGKALLLDSSLNEIKKVSARGVVGMLRKISGNVSAIVIDGTVTQTVIRSAEESKVQVIVAKNFTSTDTKIELLSFWEQKDLKIEWLTSNYMEDAHYDWFVGELNRIGEGYHLAATLGDREEVGRSADKMYILGFVEYRYSLRLIEHFLELRNSIEHSNDRRLISDLISKLRVIAGGKAKILIKFANLQINGDLATSPVEE